MTTKRTRVFARFSISATGALALLQLSMLIAPTAQADEHRVLWRFRLDGESLGRRAVFHPDQC